ncbi:MAG TPA: hypothetical protein VK043_13185 [Burkholderiales bacterium]|nr:hypothetical protein [Burkholderiales bacterium]
MLDKAIESQSRLLAQALETYGTLMRAASESYTTLLAAQSELATAQMRQSMELWQRYCQFVQDCQPGTGSSPFTAPGSRAAARGWNGEERRKTPIAVPVPSERRKAA